MTALISLTMRHRTVCFRSSSQHLPDIFTMPFPPSLTTTPFDRSSTGRFEANSCKPTSGGLLPSSVQQHKLSLAFVTHVRQAPRVAFPERFPISRPCQEPIRVRVSGHTMPPGKRRAAAGDAANYPRSHCRAKPSTFESAQATSRTPPRQSKPLPYPLVVPAKAGIHLALVRTTAIEVRSHYGFPPSREWRGSPRLAPGLRATI